ncbi:MAG: isoprenyl transferase [Thermodesulfobacteriota bacterium]
MVDQTSEKLPFHIAVIMDGNGRWAKKRLLNRIKGHSKGIEAARDIITFCTELGIGCLTLYTFSRENWNRPAIEVKLLMGLLEKHLRSEGPKMLKNNIRFKAIGSIDDLPGRVRKVVDEVEELTKDNDGMILQLALSYSGREEITAAARALSEKIAKGELKPEDITEELFGDFLYTKGVPDPDLLVRTSGESRISNFLLWQMAYSEIYISDVLWPDFTREHLLEAIRDFQARERRYGLTGEQKVELAG